MMMMKKNLCDAMKKIYDDDDDNKKFLLHLTTFSCDEIFFSLQMVCTPPPRTRQQRKCAVPPPPRGVGLGGPPGGDSPGGGAGPLCPLRARGGGVGTGGPPRGGRNTPFFSEKTPPLRSKNSPLILKFSQKKCVFSTCPKNRNFALFDPPTPKMFTFLKFCTFLHFFAKIAFFHFFALFSLFGGSPPAMHTFNLLHFATLSNIINYCHNIFLTSSSKPLLSPNFHNFIL